MFSEYINETNSSVFIRMCFYALSDNGIIMICKEIQKYKCGLSCTTTKLKIRKRHVGKGLYCSSKCF